MLNEALIVAGLGVIAGTSIGVLFLQTRADRRRQERMCAEFMERRNERARELDQRLRAGAARATSSIHTPEARGNEAVRRSSQSRSSEHSNDLLNPMSMSSPLNPIHNSWSDDSCSRSSSSSFGSFGSCSGSSSSNSGSSSSCSSSSCD